MNKSQDQKINFNTLSTIENTPITPINYPSFGEFTEKYNGSRTLRMLKEN